jgi:hypothetical protein
VLSVCTPLPNGWGIASQAVGLAIFHLTPVLSTHRPVGLAGEIGSGPVGSLTGIECTAPSRKPEKMREVGGSEIARSGPGSQNQETYRPIFPLRLGKLTETKAGLTWAIGLAPAGLQRTYANIGPSTKHAPSCAGSD